MVAEATIPSCSKLARPTATASWIFTPRQEQRQLEFHGYGNGTFTQVDSTHWAIGYENNSHSADVIEILGGVPLNDYHFIV